MKLRGNFLLLSVTEFLTGILLIILFSNWGDYGLIGMVPYLIILVLTMKKDMDEREIFLAYKINNYESIILGTAMGVIYFFFPAVNWFYTLFIVSFLSKGIIGFITFKTN